MGGELEMGWLTRCMLAGLRFPELVRCAMAKRPRVFVAVHSCCQPLDHEEEQEEEEGGGG